MRHLSILVVIILCLACQKEARPERPEDLIPMDKMENILYEIYILNAAKGINKKLLEVKGVNPESYVFEKYSIDSIQFAKSNEFYSYNIEQYQSILDTLKYRFEKEKSVLDKIKEEETAEQKRKRDSLKDRTIDADSIIPIPKVIPTRPDYMEKDSIQN